MLQLHIWLWFLRPQRVSLQKDQKDLDSYKSSYSFESYVASRCFTVKENIFGKQSGVY